MELASLEIKVKRSENLPVLPQVASSILRLADDPDAGTRELERLIGRDPAVAAKVLKVSNSSYYGLNQVPSINRAIAFLGVNAVRSLVVGIAYQQMIGAKQTSKLFSNVEFFRHSLAVATAARILGKLKMTDRSEDLYSAGLMHDVGLLVMDRFAPNELDHAISFAKEQGLQMHQAEQLVYEFDHTQIGELLADTWGLTGALRNAIRYHHTPTEDPGDMKFTTFVTVADLLAHQCGYGHNFADQPMEIDADLLDVVGIPDEQLGAIRGVITAEVEKAQDALQIKVAA